MTIVGVRDGVVVDIGGTSTDCGMLVDGFPRPAAATVKVSALAMDIQFTIHYDSKSE